MKKIIVLAIVFALATGILLLTYLKNLEKRNTVDSVGVVVAASDIPAYTAITADMVTIRQIPVSAVHPASVSDPSAVEGLLSESVILADEQILPAKLKTIGSSEDGMAFAVKAGYRAITIPATEITGVAYSLKVGDYVDVLGTISNYPARSDDKYLAMLYASDCKVLAVGFDTGEEENAIAYATVTLQATTAQAMRITVGLTEGTVRLALRGVNDHGASDPAYLWPSSLLPADALREAG